MNSCTQYVNKQPSAAKHNASSPEEVLQKMYSEWCGKKYLIKTRMVKIPSKIVFQNNNNELFGVCITIMLIQLL